MEVSMTIPPAGAWNNILCDVELGYICHMYKGTVFEHVALPIFHLKS